MKTIQKVFALILAAGLFLAVGCGCNSSKSSTAYSPKYYDEPAEAMSMAAYAEEEMADMDGAPALAAGGITTQRAAENGAKAGDYAKKIIYTAHLTVRTEDVELASEKAQQACESLGGYLSDSRVESYSDGTKYANMTLRVPAETLNSLLDSLQGIGKVESKNLSSNDITREYYDIQARLDTAKAEERQLVKLLENCETVEETLMVRSQLESVRETIESYQTSINLFDNEVAYSTVYLNVLETEKTAPEKEDDIIELWKASDVGRKISLGFQNGWRFALNAVYGIGIVLANALIPIIIIGGIGVGIFFLIRAIVRKSKAKKKAKAEKKPVKEEKKPAKEEKQNPKENLKEEKEEPSGKR